jgi:hypothetical protein
MIQFESIFGTFLMSLESGRALGIQCTLMGDAWQILCSNGKAVLLLSSTIVSFARRDPELVHLVLNGADSTASVKDSELSELIEVAS